MDEVASLYETSLKRLFPIEADRELMKQVGYSITQQRGVFGELQFAFINREPFYTYKSMIGDSIEFQFDWDAQKLTIEYLGTVLTITIAQFRSWMSYTDLLLSPILPLGTMVELNQDKLPRRVIELMEEANVSFKAIILGRRVIFGSGSHGYIDYLVSLYPYGLRPDVEPILIPAYYIKTVLQEGQTDELDKNYIRQQYRIDYFKQNIVSEVYHK